MACERTLTFLEYLFQNAHCECPAGRGPTATCKHVVGMLNTLEHFKRTGELRVQESCTEKLQSFKKPSQVHKKNAVLARELGKGDRSEDPRPQHFQNMPGW
jgi:uncharacterized Zn finger protein